MLMQVPTLAAAVAYVQGIEANWYGAASPVKFVGASYINGEAATPGVDVITGENHWSVWLQLNGEIYGEC